MKKEQREKYLKELAKSTMGEALKDFLEEKIDELKDVTRLPAEHLEVQARANIMAILKLKKIIHILNLGKEDTEKKKNEYI